MNYDAIVSLARHVLHDFAKNGYVDARRGLVESHCNAEQLCELATLVGVSDLVYQHPKMPLATAPKPKDL